VRCGSEFSVGCSGCLLLNWHGWREDNRVYFYDLCDSPLSLSYYVIYFFANFVPDVKSNGNAVINFVGFYASTISILQAGTAPGQT
jgi:hypothetical protein